MELVFLLQYLMYAFLAGLTVGSGLFCFGIVVGRLMEGGRLRKVKEPEYDPDAAPMDDAFFDRALASPEDGGHEFPTDQQLEELHRHSL
jgi:hypothetical protein